jgi:hypothetical protein
MVIHGRTACAARTGQELSPDLNGEGARVHRVWGKVNLDDTAWSEVEASGESAYLFFRVTVEMP